jgi:glutamate--cysteine ligase catalytic subunit
VNANIVMRTVQALPYLSYVRAHGVQQFINRYEAVKGIRNDDLKWGDELEYGILKVWYMC